MKQATIVDDSLIWPFYHKYFEQKRAMPKNKMFLLPRASIDRLVDHAGRTRNARDHMLFMAHHPYAGYAGSVGDICSTLEGTGEDVKLWSLFWPTAERTVRDLPGIQEGTPEYYAAVQASCYASIHHIFPAEWPYNWDDVVNEAATGERHSSLKVYTSIRDVGGRTAMETLYPQVAAQAREANDVKKDHPVFLETHDARWWGVWDNVNDTFIPSPARRAVCQQLFERDNIAVKDCTRRGDRCEPRKCFDARDRVGSICPGSPHQVHISTSACPVGTVTRGESANATIVYGGDSAPSVVRSNLGGTLHIAHGRCDCGGSRSDCWIDEEPC